MSMRMVVMMKALRRINTQRRLRTGVPTLMGRQTRPSTPSSKSPRRPMGRITSQPSCARKTSRSGSERAMQLSALQICIAAFLALVTVPGRTQSSMHRKGRSGRPRPRMTSKQRIIFSRRGYPSRPSLQRCKWSLETYQRP